MGSASGFGAIRSSSRPRVFDIKLSLRQKASSMAVHGVWCGSKTYVLRRRARWLTWLWIVRG